MKTKTKQYKEKFEIHTKNEKVIKIDLSDLDRIEQPPFSVVDLYMDKFSKEYVVSPNSRVLLNVTLETFKNIIELFIKTDDEYYIQNFHSISGR